MIPAAVVLLAALLGVAAGRLAGRWGWLLVPALPGLAAVASLASEGYVDPILLVVSIAWAIVAVLGVVAGLALRRRARAA